MLRICKRLDSFLQSCLFACYCALGTFQPQNRQLQTYFASWPPNTPGKFPDTNGGCKFPHVMGPASRDVSKLTSVPIFEKRLTSSQPSQLASLSIFINHLIREYLIWSPPTSNTHTFQVSPKSVTKQSSPRKRPPGKYSTKHIHKFFLKIKYNQHQKKKIHCREYVNIYEYMHIAIKHSFSTLRGF